jgi:hypothetical protein
MYMQTNLRSVAIASQAQLRHIAAQVPHASVEAMLAALLTDMAHLMHVYSAVRAEVCAHIKDDVPDAPEQAVTATIATIIAAAVPSEPASPGPGATVTLDIDGAEEHDAQDPPASEEHEAAGDLATQLQMEPQADAQANGPDAMSHESAPSALQAGGIDSLREELWASSPLGVSPPAQVAPPHAASPGPARAAASPARVQASLSSAEYAALKMQQGARRLWLVRRMCSEGRRT